MSNLNTLATGYLAIGTAYTSGVLTELAGNGYSRNAVTLTYNSVTNVIGIQNGVNFGPASGALAAGSYLAVYDAAIGGNLLLAWPWAVPAQSSGTSYSLPANANLGSFLPALAGPSPDLLPPQGIVGTVNAYNPSLGATAPLYNGAALLFSASYTLTVSQPNYLTAGQVPVFPRNVLDGGDFTTNPFQRNIPGLAAGGVISTPVTSTPTYFADRWFGVGGASSAIIMAAVANTTVLGFNTALQFGRQSGNANTAAINLGQAIETVDSVRLQGKQATFSFWAQAGANFSGGTITANVITGTGSNQSAATLAAGTWTGMTVAGSATIAPTTTAARYQLLANIPANATQVGVLITYTPTGTAGANDNVQFMGFQLEQGAGASNFEHRDVQLELEIAQRYAWVTPEPAANVVVGSGMNTGASAQVIYMATPVQLRVAPTVTVSAGTFKTNQSGTATATTITAGATHTPNAISINGNSAGTAGQGTLLQGGGGSGYIIASADF